MPFPPIADSESASGRLAVFTGQAERGQSRNHKRYRKDRQGHHQIKVSAAQCRAQRGRNCSRDSRPSAGSAHARGAQVGRIGFRRIGISGAHAPSVKNDIQTPINTSQLSELAAAKR